VNEDQFDIQPTPTALLARLEELARESRKWADEAARRARIAQRWLYVSIVVVTAAATNLVLTIAGVYGR
jgi:type IV secretory pathway component VirB8